MTRRPYQIHHRLTLVAALSVLLLCRLALADSAASTVGPGLATDSPSQEMLGLHPISVIRPGAPQALSISLLAGVPGLTSGAALDFAPVWLFLGSHVALGDWQDHYYDRLASWFTLSIGAGLVEQGQVGFEFGGGVRLTLWDDFDPRLDRGLQGCLDGIGENDAGGILGCKRAALAHRRRDKPWGIAATIAEAWTGTIETPTKFDRIEVWGAVQIGRYLIVSGNYLNSTVLNGQSATAGLRGVVDGTRVHLYLDLAWTPFMPNVMPEMRPLGGSPPSTAELDRGGVQGTIQVQIMDPIWAEVVLGALFGGQTSQAERNPSVMFNLKLNLGDDGPLRLWKAGA